MNAHPPRNQLEWWREATGLSEPTTVPVGVSVEVGAFRFTSTQGVPKGLVSSVLSTRRRKTTYRRPKCVPLISLGYGGQRRAYDEAMASGVWA